MLVVLFVCCIFCVLSGGIIGFLCFAAPRLMGELKIIREWMVDISHDSRKSAMYLQKLYELQVQMEKEAGGLPPGVYEELPDGRLVNTSRPGHNGSVLPGGLSVSGIRPSEVQT